MYRDMRHDHCRKCLSLHHSEWIWHNNTPQGEEENMHNGLNLKEFHSLVACLSTFKYISLAETNIWAEPRQRDLQESLRRLAGYRSEKTSSGNTVKRRSGEGNDETILVISLSDSWSREKQISLEYTSGSQ